MSRRDWIVASLSVAALALGGCRSSSEPRYHDFAAAPTTGNGSADRCVRLEVSVLSPYDGRSIGYRVAAGDALSWYRFERWSDGAATVVAGRLERSLRSAGVRTVETASECPTVGVVVERLEEVDVGAGTKAAEAWAELDAEFRIDGASVQRYSGRSRAAELEVPAVVDAFGEVIDEFAAVISGQID